MVAPPPCPQPQSFDILTGFITPGSDFPGPHPLDGSISVAVLDPTENNEPVRIVETTDPWNLEVDWCICGAFADAFCGCWTVQVFIDDIDGVGPTSGLLGTFQVDVQSQPVVNGQRCYEHIFNFAAGSVGAGCYNLVVVITLTSGTCANPGNRVQDTLGYALIPVLVFFTSP